jgi:hypothetical protein
MGAAGRLPYRPALLLGMLQSSPDVFVRVIRHFLAPQPAGKPIIALRYCPAKVNRTSRFSEKPLNVGLGQSAETRTLWIIQRAAQVRRRSPRLWNIDI